MKTTFPAIAAVAWLLATSVFGATQESKSSALAKELVQLLDQAKLDSIAAQDPADKDVFVAALYFPGSQLLVVSAKYPAAVLLQERINKKEFRDVYIDLNSASVPNTKIFVEDLVCDGLKPTREQGEPFDTYENSNTRLAFDSDWKAQKVSESEYMKVFHDADERYAKILSLLVSQLKKPS